MTVAKDHYRTVTPYLIVSDADAELRFLQEAFGGVETEAHRGDDDTVMHAEVRIGDSLVMIGQASAEWPSTRAAVYLWIDDVDATYARALAAGGRSESAPEDKPYGHRKAGVIDANDNIWWIAAPVK